MEPSEKTLIELSLLQDEAAFAVLMSRYENKIYQHVLGIVKEEMTAQDIKQETFVTAYEKLNTFRGDSSFYTWIYRIAHNKALNFLKKNKKYKTQPLEENKIPQPRKESPCENSLFLEEALEKLSPKQKEVFQLYFLEKKSQKEIAYQLNVPLGTVRSRLFYAKIKIRECL